MRSSTIAIIAIAGILGGGLPFASSSSAKVQEKTDADKERLIKAEKKRQKKVKKRKGLDSE